jgi:hypothetical protein
MRKIKEVLRLRFELRLGQREIARACSISQGAIHTGLLQLLKPFGAVAKHFCVIGLVGVGAQRLEGLPDRHIDDDEGIMVVSDVRGVAADSDLSRQTKPEASSASALMGSSSATNSAILGSSSGATRRAMLIWAR